MQAIANLPFFAHGSLSPCRFTFPKVIFVYINFALAVGGKKASIDLVVTIHGRDSLITTTSLQLQSC